MGNNFKKHIEKSEKRIFRMLSGQWINAPIVCIMVKSIRRSKVLKSTPYSPINNRGVRSVYDCEHKCQESEDFCFNPQSTVQLWMHFVIESRWSQDARRGHDIECDQSIQQIPTRQEIADLQTQRLVETVSKKTSRTHCLIVRRDIFHFLETPFAHHFSLPDAVDPSIRPLEQRQERLHVIRDSPSHCHAVQAKSFWTLQHEVYPDISPLLASDRWSSRIQRCTARSKPPFRHLSSSQYIRLACRSTGRSRSLYEHRICPRQCLNTRRNACTEARSLSLHKYYIWGPYKKSQHTQKCTYSCLNSPKSMQSHQKTKLL